MRSVAYPTPGSILESEFLEPMNISRYKLAKEINVQQRRIDEIVSGSRAITADTGLRLSRFFGLSDVFWTNLQAGYDTAMAKDQLGDVLDTIRPYQFKETTMRTTVGKRAVVRKVAYKRLPRSVMKVAAKKAAAKKSAPSKPKRIATRA